MPIGLLIGLASSAASTGLGIAGAKAQAEAEQRAARYRASINRKRALHSDIAARRTRRRGRVQARMRTVVGEQQRGSITAGFASQGVSTSTGTAAILASQVDAATKADEITLMLNAEMAAEDYEAQADEYRQAAVAAIEVGEDAARAGRLNAAGAGIGGVMHITQMADRAGLFKQAGGLFSRGRPSTTNSFASRVDQQIGWMR